MAQDFTWLLENLMEAVPHTRGALLLSGDGMIECYRGVDENNAARDAAMASAICSLASAWSRETDGNGTIGQVMMELPKAIVVITAASVNTVLAVVSDTAVDAGLLGHEMAQLGKQLRAALATPARRPAGNGLPSQ